MTAPDLSAIRAQLAAITPGPWEVFASDCDYPPVDYSIITSSHGDEVACFDNHERNAGEALNDVTADAAFIAAAPETVARLLGALERVEALHVPDAGHNPDCDCGIPSGDGARCCECYKAWPCPTIKAITGELEQGLCGKTIGFAHNGVGACQLVKGHDGKHRAAITGEGK